MRKLLGKIWEWAGYLFLLFLVVSLVSWVFEDQVEGLFAADQIQVKKSASGICHCPGGTYFERTRNFTAYWSIKDCLASGGRHPKRGQGDCTKVTPQPGSPEAISRTIRPKSTTIKRRDLDKPRPPKLEMRIVDGDTIHLGKVRVRLHGIDAPEAAQTCRNAVGETYPCGEQATSALILMAAAGVRCEPAGDEQDKYGRMIATCYAVDGTNVNADMVRSGYALAYREYSEEYISEEEMARDHKRGMHRGTFVAPWDWRRGKRLQ